MPDSKTSKTIENIENAQKSKTLSISLNPKSDSNVSGVVLFTETNGMVKMNAKVSGLSDGLHAIHIHQTSDCSSVDGKSAGGHWNPTNQPHGKWGVETGYHKGDIGNFMVNSCSKGYKELLVGETVLIPRSTFTNNDGNDWNF